MGLILDFDPEAERDLRNIQTWLTERSPSGARNVLADIMRTVDLLLEQPGIGRPLRGRSMRMRVTRRYRYAILYQVTGERLIVRAVYHPRRNRPV